MPAAIDINVKVNGGIFTKDVDQVVRDAMAQEAIDKLSARMSRGGKGLGVQRNPIRLEVRGALETAAISSLNAPRTTGSSWRNKNVAIAKSLLPRVLKKAADRIVEEMGANG